jgi:hypothetical protein
MMSGCIDTPRCSPQPTGNPSNSTCNVEEAPEATVIIPPRSKAVLSETATTQRDRHVEAIGNHGRVSRQRSSIGKRRSLIEIVIYRYKVIIG